MPCLVREADHGLPLWEWAMRSGWPSAEFAHPTVYSNTPKGIAIESLTTRCEQGGMDRRFDSSLDVPYQKLGEMNARSDVWGGI